jgi:hypothetical protein
VHNKVVYDHTRIASYPHWGARSVAEQVRLLALDSRRGVLTSTLHGSKLAGGMPSGPILSGLSRTVTLVEDRWPNSEMDG